MSVQPTLSRRKHCFVTVGATADFDSLVRATLSPPFLTALKANGYTDLRLQYGGNGATILKDFFDSAREKGHGDLDVRISGFDFNKQGLGYEMKDVKGGNGAVEGVVISHAGALSPMP